MKISIHLEKYAFYQKVWIYLKLSHFQIYFVTMPLKQLFSIGLVIGALFPSLVPGVGSRDHLEQKEGQEVAPDPVLHFFVVCSLSCLGLLY